MVSVSNAIAITMADAAADACDTGTTNAQATLVIYDGTPPTNVDTALSGNTVLSQQDMSNPAWGSAADNAPGAIVTAAAISDDASADATGTASFYRILDRDNTPCHQGTVGTSGAELNLNSVSIVAGLPVSITSLVLIQLES